MSSKNPPIKTKSLTYSIVSFLSPLSDWNERKDHVSIKDKKSNISKQAKDEVKTSWDREEKVGLWIQVKTPEKVTEITYSDKRAISCSIKKSS